VKDTGTKKNLKENKQQEKESEGKEGKKKPQCNK